MIVAAAGNEHNDNATKSPTRPAKCPGVIGVAALNRDGFKSTYSNFGPTLTVATVGGDNADGLDPGAWDNLVADSGLLAVGNTGDTGPVVTGYYPRYFGTSFSTPIVAGAVSLMLGRQPGAERGADRSGPARFGTAACHLRACPEWRHAATPTQGVACAPPTPAAPACSMCRKRWPYANALKLGNPYTPPTWPVVSINSAQLRDAAAAGPDRPANPAAPPSGGGDGGDGDNDSGGGGGAMSAWWLLALSAAVLALRRRAAPR